MGLLFRPNNKLSVSVVVNIAFLIIMHHVVGLRLKLTQDLHLKLTHPERPIMA